MKTPTPLLLGLAACFPYLGFSQETPKPAEPRPGPEVIQPAPPERREDGGQPPRPDRPEGAGPDDQGRPQRRFDGPGADRPNRPYRPDGQPGDQPGGQPFRPDGQPGDRPYRLEGSGDGRGPARPFANQPMPMKLQAFLGVVTRGAPLELTVQLKQPDGFGLIVEDVLGDGPAAAAGIQQNDLLRMFEDQWLVNPGQLEALVRRAGKDKEVSLTILRGGVEQKVTVKIGEKLLPVRRPLLPGNNNGPGGFGQEGEPGNYQNRMPRDGFRGGDDFRGAQGGQAPLDRQTRYATDRARVVRHDESGVYEISRFNGARVFGATKPDGTPIWKGPVDTEEDRKAMPEDVRKKFEELEKSRPLERLGERPPGPGGPDGQRQPENFRPQEGPRPLDNQRQPDGGRPRAGNPTE